MDEESICTGASTELVIFKQNDRASLFDTLHPFVTFHSSLSSSVDEGSIVFGVSDIWMDLENVVTVGGALKGPLILV